MRESEKADPRSTTRQRAEGVEPPMDAASSFQVLVAVAVLTIAMIAATRIVGLAASGHHADLPPIPGATAPGTDIHRLVAILTAAAAEMMDAEADEIALTSIVEVSTDPGHHWPRLGRFQRHHGRPTTRF
jgi:hypothetical protein